MARDRYQILILDDSPAEAQVLQAMLSNAFQDDLLFTVTHDIGDAHAELSRTQYDAVFVDFRLEEGNGFDLLRRLRQEGSDVAVIVITGYGSEELAVEALRLGAQDYMAKGSLSGPTLRRSLTYALRIVQRDRELRAKHKELTDFAHVAAHDLKAPLRRINGFVQVLKEELEGHPNQDVHTLLDNIHRVGSSMTHLVSDLLAYARAGRTNRPLTPMDLRDAVDLALDHLKDEVDRCGAIVHIGTMPAVRGDLVALAQLFQNVLSNSLKYRSERRLVVDISCEPSENRAVVRITDNGVGYDPRTAGDVFEPFRRAHGRDYEGSGIGLATCRRIATQHGGLIIATSRPGVGTTITLRLPIFAARLPEHPDEAPPPEQA